MALKLYGLGKGGGCGEINVISLYRFQKVLLPFLAHIF